jgi:glycerol kinase
MRRSGKSVGSGILAIDQGTSGTKALVVDAAGEVRSVVEIPVSSTARVDGGVEQDPVELLASVLAAGRRAIKDAGIDVEAVGVANQGETVLAWDRRTGEVLASGHMRRTTPNRSLLAPAPVRTALGQGGAQLVRLV